MLILFFPLFQQTISGMPAVLTPYRLVLFIFFCAIIFRYSYGPIKSSTNIFYLYSIIIDYIAKMSLEIADALEKRKLRELYPEIEPYRTGMLKVSEIHSLYYEEVGNPSGKPIVFIHGGPGSGTGSRDRRFFDPQAYRIIIYHQRGAGNSIPSACLEENTTWDLVDDLEKLRKHFNIDRWLLFSDNCGSALALAYAETHPNRVKALILHEIFCYCRKELLWSYQDGA
jgi:hypothetical protein